MRAYIVKVYDMRGAAFPATLVLGPHFRHVQVPYMLSYYFLLVQSMYWSLHLLFVQPCLLPLLPPV